MHDGRVVASLRAPRDVPLDDVGDVADALAAMGRWAGGTREQAHSNTPLVVGGAWRCHGST